MYANETAMHQLKAVEYIATLDLAPLIFSLPKTEDTDKRKIEIRAVGDTKICVSEMFPALYETLA